ncbi:MAG: hypothetical protein WC711_01755 [Candidatus Staskawiczbacteria bacterium]|jgi:hypothetical protein
MRDRLIAIARKAVGNTRFIVISQKGDYLRVTLDGFDVGTFIKRGGGGYSSDNMLLAESILGLEHPPEPAPAPAPAESIEFDDVSVEVGEGLFDGIPEWGEGEDEDADEIP